MRTTSLVIMGLGIASLTAQDWRPAYPANSPGPRFGARLVYDAARSELVLFGGNSATAATNETWTWNGTNWTQRFPAVSPPARSGHAMCYDSTRQRVVVYGGYPLNDTWEWDGTNWTQRTPATSPPLRWSPTITYTGTRTLLFGGGAVGGGYLADTWVWSGVSWAQVTPSTSPPARQLHSLASQGGGQALLFGGFDGNGHRDDTWTWSGTNWSQVASTVAPSTRSLAGLVWDSANSRFLLFGGFDSFLSTLEDTWALTAGQWTQLVTQRSPSTRQIGGAAAWFVPQNRMVIYSSEYLSNSNLKSTPMWEFGQGLASFIRFGPSVCPFPDPPALRGYQSQPALGTTFTAQVESVGSVLTSIAIGVSNTTWAGGALPFDLAAFGANPNCLLYVSPDVLAYLGFGQIETWSLAIPNNPTLLGFTMYAQGFTWGLGGLFNVSLSNAATLVVGLD